METNIKHVKLPKTRSDYPSRAILERYPNAKNGTITLLYIEIHKLSGLNPFQTTCSSNLKLDHPRYQVIFLLKLDFRFQTTMEPFTGDESRWFSSQVAACFWKIYKNLPRIIAWQSIVKYFGLENGRRNPELEWSNHQIIKSWSSSKISPWPP